MLTQSDLGLLCGLTRATVSRVPTWLSADGAIELGHGRITARDRAALLRHAERIEARGGLPPPRARGLIPRRFRPTR